MKQLIPPESERTARTETNNQLFSVWPHYYPDDIVQIKFNGLPPVEGIVVVDKKSEGWYRFTTEGDVTRLDIHVRWKGLGDAYDWIPCINLINLTR
jgi:hypothetical protein